MSIWNDTENTESSGEVTEGYFGESSDNARDAPKHKRPRRKAGTQDQESNYRDNNRSFTADDSTAFSEDEAKAFTEDGKRSFGENSNKAFNDNSDIRKSDGFNHNNSNSDGIKTSDDKKKEYHKRLKEKAKEKREAQNRLSEEEVRKETESFYNQSTEDGSILADSSDGFQSDEIKESIIKSDVESGNIGGSDFGFDDGDEETSGFGFGNWDDNNSSSESVLNTRKSRRNAEVNTCNSGEEGVLNTCKSRGESTPGQNGRASYFGDYESNYYDFQDSVPLNSKSGNQRNTKRNASRTDQQSSRRIDNRNTCTNGNINRKTNADGNYNAKTGLADKGNSDGKGNSGKGVSDKKTGLTLFGGDETTPAKPSKRIVSKTTDKSLKATDYSIHKAGETISKATGEKDDNAGADALHLAEEGGETVSRYGFYIARDIKDNFTEAGSKAVKKTSDFTTDSIFDAPKEKLTKEQRKKLAYKKQLQKKRRKAAQKAKKAAKEAGKQTAEGTKKAVSAAKMVVKTVIRTVFAVPRAILIILLILLVLLLFGGEMAGSVTSLTTEAASILSAATYNSSPQMIDQADLDFSYMELMLREQIDEIEDEYPDYDEYTYTLGSIGHDPFTLINYLHAEFGTIDSDAMACLNDLFNAMYELKLTPTEETRYRLVPKPPEEDEDEDESEDDTEEDEDEEDDDSGETEGDDEEEDDEDEEPEYILEEYTVSILKVELISRSLESVVDGRLEGNSTGKAIYAVLNKTHGLVQYIGSPVFQTWSVESYYGYRRNPYGDYPELHRGLDISMPAGTSVHSAITGFVKEIGSDPMFGDYVVIEDDRYTVKYASMGSISVIVDSLVHRGETVGYTGSNGSEPPSLHMELLVNGTYYNPLFYTENPQHEPE